VIRNPMSTTSGFSRPVGRLCLLLLGALLLGSTAGSAAEVRNRGTQPHIVWINCEDLDDTLGCYGDPHAITPHLDALAQEGVVFRQAFANAPICAPARNCLITGMYPTSLGAQHLRCEITLPPDVEPFPVHLKRAGYFVTNQAKTDYNFDPAGIYDYWRNDFAPWRKREREDQPFFSFFVLGTTHEGPGNRRERYEKETTGLSPEKRTAPESIRLPPYFPDTPAMRELWARYYDLVAAMDEEVGEILANLKRDGLWEDTIVFFFSDHGHGMPRHKRWLLDSGLRVPLIVRIPGKYRDLAPDAWPGSQSGRLVSFVDFAPTVLGLAGVKPPENLQGEAFLGPGTQSPRPWVFGARDRADDMFELSRCVHDGRFIYVRHFLPQLPYLQGGRIFGNDKESLRELRRARDAGDFDSLPPHLFAERKPVEEFYDLREDPHEIANLIGDSRHGERIASMRDVLKRWILEHRDTGFLPESEYTRRAREAGLSIREMALSPEHYDLPAILAQAWGDGAETESGDPGVSYWRIMQDDDSLTREDLVGHVNDGPGFLQVAAAQALCERGDVDAGLPVLVDLIRSSDLRLALEAARSLFLLGDLAEPVVAEVEEARRALEAPPGGRRRYRDFNYASFTGWALEGVLVNCGAARWEDYE